MSQQDMPPSGSKSKTRLPWFKMYPEAYLEDTRELTPEARGIYFDCLCLIYKYDSDLPRNDAWMAFELHVNARVWRRVRDVLIERGKLIETPNGYTNKRASIELEERRERRSNKVSSAIERANERRIAPELPFEINGRSPKLRVVSDHKSTTEVPPRARVIRSSEEEREIEELKMAKPMPPDLREALSQQEGQERADGLIEEYYRDPFGAIGAQSIRRAFPAWLEKGPKIVLQGWKDGKASSMASLATQILDQCTRDAHGRPITTMPTPEQMAARGRK